MNTIIRTLRNRRGIVVLLDSRNQILFSKGNLKTNTRDAEMWVGVGRPGIATPERDTVLFATDPCSAQLTCHITDGGDQSEPEALCNNSLIRLTDDLNRQVILTAEELDSLARQWLALRNPSHCGPPASSAGGREGGHP